MVLRSGPVAATGFVAGCVLAGALILAGCGGGPEPGKPAAAPAAGGAPASSGVAAPRANVDGARLAAADADTPNWLTHGRTYAEQRFSPLKSIDESNVAQLGLAWYYDLGTTRGVEATPLVVDGVMYTTSAWSIVYALDAKTGRELWVYDPKVPKRWGQFACCDVVNRGVAVWGGKVFVGTLDGRLDAIDAATGKLVWE
jgi:glucose dehydrogenase